MTVVLYEAKYKQRFIELNLDWIEEYFSVEQGDTETFEHLDELIAGGAEVYSAVENGMVVFVCMTVPEGRGVWEICKLATDRSFRGRGAGRAVFESCMKYAVSRGAKKLTILSNRKLVPAIGLYLSCGFREVPAEDVGYERVDILLEKTICE